MAPDFQLPGLDGRPTRLSDLRGKVVVLNFWATWCPECVIEIPSLNAFADAYRGQDVAILAVSVDKSEEAVREFLVNNAMRFTVLLDREGEVFVGKYTTRALPSTVLIDRSGRIAVRLPGQQDFRSRGFDQRVRELLERSE